MPRVKLGHYRIEEFPHDLNAKTVRVVPLVPRLCPDICSTGITRERRGPMLCEVPFPCSTVRPVAW